MFYYGSIFQKNCNGQTAMMNVGPDMKGSDSGRSYMKRNQSKPYKDLYERIVLFKADCGNAFNEIERKFYVMNLKYIYFAPYSFQGEVVRQMLKMSKMMI